jgi:hypothetical protein
LDFGVHRHDHLHSRFGHLCARWSAICRRRRACGCLQHWKTVVLARIPGLESIHVTSLAVMRRGGVPRQSVIFAHDAGRGCSELKCHAHLCLKPCLCCIVFMTLASGISAYRLHIAPRCASQSSAEVLLQTGGVAVRLLLLSMVTSGIVSRSRLLVVYLRERC